MQRAVQGRQGGSDKDVLGPLLLQVVSPFGSKATGGHMYSCQARDSGIDNCHSLKVLKALKVELQARACKAGDGAYSRLLVFCLQCIARTPTASTAMRAALTTATPAWKAMCSLLMGPVVRLPFNVRLLDP